MVITKTPLRISLLGGSTDMPSFYKKNVGCVISFAINRYIYISVNKKFDGKLRVSYSKTENVNHVDELQHNIVRETLKSFGLKSGLEITSVSDIPGEGSGLGSSSAFTVGLINALKGEELHPAKLAERAYLIESEKCGQVLGKQDQYASAFGGLNFFEFSNFVTQHPMWGSKWDVQKGIWNIDILNSWFLLLWTGRTRKANSILLEQSQNIQKDNGIGIALADLTRDCYIKMLYGINHHELGEFIHTAWNLKRRLAKGITDIEIDTIYKIGMANGATGGKLLGAGGGGFMLFVAEPDAHNRIAKATGLRKIDFKIELQGSQVIYDV